MLIGFRMAGIITDMYVLEVGHNWKEIWAYPAVFAAVVLVIFILTFKNEKIIVKIIKMKMLGWGYRPPLEHSPIRLSKGKIKFKTRRKKMTLAEKKKFLARLNKGRIKAGLKPIRAKR